MSHPPAGGHPAGVAAGDHTTAAPLQVRVLGPLEVERVGRIVSLGSPAQRRVLATLVAANGTTVRLERLVDAVWGADPPASARNSLQSHVARLRRELGGDAPIETVADGYRLARSDVEVDATTFEAALHTARRTIETDPRTAARALEDAMALWRGEAYIGVDGDPIRAEARRLAELRVDAVLLLADACGRAGVVARALEELSRLAATEPLREDVVLAHVRALAAAGRLIGALEVLRAFRARLADELGLDPTRAFAEVERTLLRGDVPAPTPPPGVPTAVAGTPPRHRPVAPPHLHTPTHGREDDLQRLRVVTATSALVTLTGPGGVGKTRLAITYVADHDPVAWIDLADVGSEADLPGAVADGLGVALPGDGDADMMAAVLARFPGVAVLDNAEHLLDAVASLVRSALGQAGPVRLLVTSRERLDLPGEAVVPVAPLPVPTSAQAGLDDAAVRLFLERHAAAGGTGLGPRDAAAVAAAVDGLPLAIELAAARAVALPIGSLVEQLTERLDLLTGSRRRHGARHHTLAGVIAWSHDRLGVEEQRLFHRLSVFAGSPTLADIEQVCADGRLSATTVAGVLARLVDQSLVERVGAERFRLLQPLRRFAADRLAEAPDDRVAVEDRHRRLLLDLATRADRAMLTADEASVLPEVEAALPDLRAVHTRAVAGGDLAAVAALAGRLHRFAYLQARHDLLSWGAALLVDVEVTGADPADTARAVVAALAGSWMRGRFDEGRELARIVAARLEGDAGADPRTAGVLAEARGDAAVPTGHLDDAVEAYDRAVTLATQAGAEGAATFALAGLAMTRAFQGHVEDAERLARDAVARADRIGAASVRSLAQYVLGEAVADTDPPAALAAFGRAQASASRIRARLLEGLARTADVAVRGRHGDPAEALARYRAALRVWDDAGARGLVVTTLRNLVVLLARIGADAPALALYTALERLAPQPSYGSERRRLTAAVAAVEERLGAGVVAAVRAADELGDLPAAVRYGSAAIDAALP